MIEEPRGLLGFWYGAVNGATKTRDVLDMSRVREDNEDGGCMTMSKLAVTAVMATLWIV